MGAFHKILDWKMAMVNNKNVEEQIKKEKTLKT
jgi:hypothetical protein